MNKKQTNTRRQLQQTPPEGKRKGVVELTDADLEKVQGGKGTDKLFDACSTGTHVPKVQTTT
ncbi:hypothetical protein [Dictyobacter formicarum]|uniref:Bacteriocin n=1 Tax=Dictyobacter formicarum TaxID=2778368 RepID=A0ABQ3V9Z1_9CHLR|nr:hypothetical protein [Dictyobacter formicarum]GHO82521.1 hypothetical protein KSZ_05270 [Dictyobacter formicarum]